MSKEAMKLALEALDMMIVPRSFQAQVRIKEIYETIEAELAKKEQRSVSVSNPIGEFPKTILAVIKEVANRNPKNGLDRWTDYETGAYMQDDADAALLWIKNKAKQEHVGEPVAWMDKNKFEHLKKNNAVLTTVTSWGAFDDDVPLYTTPRGCNDKG